MAPTISAVVSFRTQPDIKTERCALSKRSPVSKLINIIYESSLNISDVGKGVKTCSFQSVLETSGAAYLPFKQPSTTLDLAKRDVFLKTLALFRALRLRGCASRTSDEVLSANANSTQSDGATVVRDLRRKVLARVKQVRHFIKLGLPAAAVRRKIRVIKSLSTAITQQMKIKGGPANTARGASNLFDICRDPRSRLNPICPGRIVIKQLTNGRSIVQ